MNIEYWRAQTKLLLKCLALNAMALALIPSKAVAKDQRDSSHPKVCAAVRGNGNHVAAHFGALSRALDEKWLGINEPFYALSGGSSAAFSIFIYDSIMANPLISECRHKNPALCREDKLKKVSLLLKSFIGVKDYIFSQTHHGRAFSAVQSLATQGKWFQAATIKYIGKSIYNFFKGMIRTGININKEFVKFFFHNGSYKGGVRFHHQHLRFNFKLLSSGYLDENDLGLFYRPGLVDMDATIRDLAHVGNFYGGRMDVPNQDLNSRFRQFLDYCSPRSVHKEWNEIDAECKVMFSQLIKDYFKITRENPVSRENDRFYDEVGSNIPVFIGTGQVKGTSMINLEKNLTQFRQGKNPTNDLRFRDLRFAYFGLYEDLQVALANPLGFSDVRTTQSHPLPGYHWGDALAFSMSEPGLSSFRHLHRGDGLSLGGWSDLQPTRILRNFGCEKILFVTRRGQESPSITSILKQFGVDENEIKDLISYEPEDESIAYQSLQEADGIICTDWDKYGFFNSFDTFGDAFIHSQYIVNDVWQSSDNDSIPEDSKKMSEIIKDEKFVGCSALP